MFLLWYQTWCQRLNSNQLLRLYEGLDYPLRLRWHVLKKGTIDLKLSTAKMAGDGRLERPSPRLECGSLLGSLISQYGSPARTRTEIVAFVERNPKSFERQSHNLKLVSGLRLELRTQGSRPWMFPLHYPLMVRNKRVERFPLLSRSRRPPLPQFLIGQRPPNRTASTSIRGSEATTTPVTD